MGDEPKGQVIDIRDQREKLSDAERTLLTSTDALIAMHREQLQQECLRHEITRGDLLIAQARIRELEDELGITDTVPPERPRSGEMRVAERTEKNNE